MDNLASVSPQDSPPYQPDEEANAMKLFSVPESEFNVWDALSLLTPPLTPVDTSSNDKEVISHFSNHQETRTLTDLPDEFYSCTQNDSICSGLRTASPAIVNDIMWNAGQRHKRPDSAMDIDVRFSLNPGTPLCFEQSISHTFVDMSTELFSFSLFETSSSSSESQHEEQSKYDNTVNSFQDFSDSEEEIDVVSVQAEPIPKITPQDHNMQQTRENTRQKTKHSLQKMKDHKEEAVSSDSDCEVTRISHNDLERKRRNELRNRFNYLRESIPSICNNEKAAKITILRKAYELIPTLKKDEKALLAEKENERRKNVELLRKLSKLSAISSRKY